MLWFVRSAILALYPRTDALPGARDTALDEALRRFRDEAPPLIWVGVLAGAALFHLSPLFTVFVPLPAFLLPLGLLDKHAYRITQSPLYLVRQTVFLVKLCGGLCWGADPEVRRRLGLGPLAVEDGEWRRS